MGTSCSKGVKTTPETHDLHTMVMRWGFEPLSRYLGTSHTRGVRSIPGTINYIPFGAPPTEATRIYMVVGFESYPWLDIWSFLGPGVEWG